MNEIYRKHRGKVDFYVVYIKEIHPTDGWQVKDNEADGVLFPQHRSFEERVEVGKACLLKTALEMPALVDAMDDAVMTAYNAMPERLYLIGRDGKVAYKGGIGPVLFLPDEWEKAIEDYLAEQRAA